MRDYLTLRNGSLDLGSGDQVWPRSVEGVLSPSGCCLCGLPIPITYCCLIPAFIALLETLAWIPVALRML